MRDPNYALHKTTNTVVWGFLRWNSHRNQWLEDKTILGSGQQHYYEVGDRYGDNFGRCQFFHSLGGAISHAYDQGQLNRQEAGMVYRYWSENGQMKEVGMCGDNGTKTGEFCYWDKTGCFVGTVYYDDGLEVKRKGMVDWWM